MIKGTGTLQVSEATIVAAVQEYLDSRLASGMAVKVDAVKPTAPKEGYVASTVSPLFDITISENATPA